MTAVRQRILAGYLTRQEFLGQTQLLAAVETPREKASVWAQYKRARTLLPSVAPMPASLPDLRAMPATSQEYLAEVEGTDSFQENFGGLDYSFRLVPIARITPIQTFCNLEPEMRPPNGDGTANLLRYALPKDSIVPGEPIITPTGVRFSTSRYGLGPQNIRRRVRGNKVELSLEHLNLVQVHRYPNLLLLLNGTHRCLELHRNGDSYVPAIVIEHQSPAEFEGPVGPGYWNQAVLFGSPRQPSHGPRPPLIPDFASDVSVECRVAVTQTVIDMNFGNPLPPQMPLGPLPGQPMAIQLAGMVPAARIG